MKGFLKLKEEAQATLTYGAFSAVVNINRVTPEAIKWFRSGACPLMAWALVHQAAQRGYKWSPALIGDAQDWGDWWHMGALTEDERLFVDVGGAYKVDVVLDWWHKKQKVRRHPGNDTAISTVSDKFYSLIWYDPRDVNLKTRVVTRKLADQIILGIENAKQGF